MFDIGEYDCYYKTRIHNSGGSDSARNGVLRGCKKHPDAKLLYWIQGRKFLSSKNVNSVDPTPSFYTIQVARLRLLGLRLPTWNIKDFRARTEILFSDLLRLDTSESNHIPTILVRDMVNLNLQVYKKLQPNLNNLTGIV